MRRMMQTGQVILGKYRIADLVGSGAEGDVAQAIDEATGRVVAVKQLGADLDDPQYPTALARFARAGNLRITHPCIPAVIEHGQDGEDWYLVTEFIDGPDLETHVATAGNRLGIDRALAFIVDLADALRSVHAHGCIHRDLKPNNILIAGDGRPRIVDFGICRNQYEATLTTDKGLVGTLCWMSPEQAQQSNRVDARSDLYALGLLFYWLLTGQPVVAGSDPTAILAAVCNHTPQPVRQLNPIVPPHLDAACMRLLAKNPTDRFQSAAELLAALGIAATCSACHAALSDASRFCPACGAECTAVSSGAASCFACGQTIVGTSSCPGCQRTFGSSDHRLTFRRGALAGKCFRIPEGMYCVGRLELCGRDPQISRRHLSVTCSNGSVLVQDAGSTNHTYVGSRPAELPLPLVPGHELRIATNVGIYTMTQA